MSNTLDITYILNVCCWKVYNFYANFIYCYLSQHITSNALCILYYVILHSTNVVHFQKYFHTFNNVVLHHIDKDIHFSENLLINYKNLYEIYYLFLIYHLS